MRLPTLPPDQLTPEQRALYDRNRQQIAHGFTAFTTTREDGALLGPWGVFLHEPRVGQAHYDLIDAVTAMKRLSPSAKQIAILVAGARFNAAYELYAHAATAAAEGMDPAKIATLAAGGRPLDLTPEETCAFDVATALLGGGCAGRGDLSRSARPARPGCAERTGALDRYLCPGRHHA